MRLAPLTMTPALRVCSQILRPSRFWVVPPLRVTLWIVLIYRCKQRIQIELIPLVRRILGPLRYTRQRALVIVRGPAILSL